MKNTRKTGVFVILILTAVLIGLLAVRPVVRQRTEEMRRNETASPVVKQEVPAEKDPRQLQRLVSELIRTCGETESISGAGIDSRVEEIRALDDRKAEQMKQLLTFWEIVNTQTEIQPKVCTGGLPEDNSLCFVVMGYELMPDGSMWPELIGRLETALNCARKYPKARIAVTGGPTASANPKATEADAMAAWLMAHGVEEDRILIENRSLSTAENALLCADLFRNRAPEIRHLVIVTSDYHIRRGIMVFSTCMLLNGADIDVIGNAAWTTEIKDSSPWRVQAYDMVSVAAELLAPEDPGTN